MSTYSDLCEKYNIELQQRWEKGTEHHPEASQLVRELADIDFVEYGDYFDWNIGGDGDNGEVLIEQMSVLFEIRDAQLLEQYPFIKPLMDANPKLPLVEILAKELQSRL